MNKDALSWGAIFGQMIIQFAPVLILLVITFALSLAFKRRLGLYGKLFDSTVGMIGLALVLFWVFTAFFAGVFDMVATHDPLDQSALMKKALPGTPYSKLIGTPDPSSTIPAGCVVLVHKGSYVEDDALIYRSPRRFEPRSATWAAAACVSSHPIPVPTLSQMAARNHLRRRIARRAQGRRPACVRCAAERGARQDAPRGGDGDGERRHFLGARRALARRHVLWRRL